MFDTRTPDGKVVLFARGTGETFVRFPVDAREMLASGGYALSLDDAMADVAGEVVPATVEPEPPMSPVGVPIVVGVAEPAAPMGEPVRQSKGRRR